MNLDLVTLVVDEYDTAIRFFVDTLGFDLVEDVPAQTESGEPKRWVVVRPPRRESCWPVQTMSARHPSLVPKSTAGSPSSCVSTTSRTPIDG